MKNTPKKIRLKDIALKANTTEATASMVLNSHRYDQVSAKTRIRIEKIAEEMGYVPNRMAQMLAHGRTDTILLLVTDIASAFVSQYITLLNGHFEFAGYTLFPLASLSDTKREAKHINFLSQRYFDGAICLEYDWHNQECYANLGTKGPMVVRTWAERNFSCPFPHVGVDYYVGMRQLFQHFADYGRSNIGVIIATPPNIDVIDKSNPRIQLYHSVFDEYNFAPENQVWKSIHLGENLYREAYSQTLKLIKANPRLDTILLHSSDLVLPVYRALSDAGVNIGADIGVAAFDDYNQLEFLHPTVTVVREPADQICRSMAKMLLARLGHEKLDSDVVQYESQVVIGKSTQR